MDKTDVVIIGAGAAGLSAARKLLEHGRDFVVVEARDRIGGRVFTHRDVSTPVPIELGAEFVHGSAPELEEILDDGSIATVDISGRRWQAADPLRSLDDFWERLQRVMSRLRKHGLDRSFADFLATKPGGRRLANDRRLTRQFVEGFHAADPALISERALADGGSPDGDVRERRIARVIDGYDRVIEWLAKPLGDNVRTAAVVTRVRWMPGSVSVETSHPDGRMRTEIHARAAIITVPLGVLKAPAGETGAIEFDPDIRDKRSVLALLEMGTVVRVALRLSERFWASEWYAERVGNTGLDTMSFIQARDEHFQTWWTAYPLRAPIIVAWSGGPDARALSRRAPEALKDLAIRSLAKLFGLSSRRIRAMVEAAWTHDWLHDPFSRGAYSYQGVGGADAPAALARPLRGTLFFAGEAAETEGRTGTVHGAIASGRHAAGGVERSLKTRQPNVRRAESD